MRVRVYKATYKRNGKKSTSRNYMLQWRDATGHVKSKSSGTRDKTLAERIARDLEKRLAEADAGLAPLERPRATIQEAIDSLLQVTRNTKRDATANCYARDLELFTKSCSRTHVHEITVSDLHAYVAMRRKSKRSPGPVSINRELRSIRRLLNYSEEQGWLLRAPKFKTVFCREDPNQPVRLTASQRDALRVAAGSAATRLGPAWWTLAIALFEILGTRRGEVLGLKWGDISQDTLTVRSEITKSAQGRQLPIPPTLLAKLQESSPEGAKATDPILPYPYTTRRQFHKDWNSIRLAAGVEAWVKPKHLRSSFASDAVAAGVPTLALQRLLGHSSPTVTAKHYVNADLQGAMRSIQDYRA